MKKPPSSISPSRVGNARLCPRRADGQAPAGVGLRVRAGFWKAGRAVSSGEGFKSGLLCAGNSLCSSVTVLLFYYGQFGHSFEENPKVLIKIQNPSAFKMAQ